MKFNGSREEFISKLNNSFKTNQEGQGIGNQFRYTLNYENKEYKINLFKTGTVQIQPQNDNLYMKVSQILSETMNVIEAGIGDGRIFIVHGHDRNSKMELENILYKWNLTPYAIQDEDSRGKTIIEFLEKEISKSAIGIVLLTGDDIGYSRKSGEDSKQPRARQNVILELGMLIGRLGREKCIILRKSDVELPSDIDGLIYIAYDKELSEIKSKLKDRLENLGLVCTKNSK